MELKIGDKVKLPFNATGTLVKILNLPWGFTHIVRIRKPGVFYKTNQRIEFREEDLIKYN